MLLLLPVTGVLAAEHLYENVSKRNAKKLRVCYC